MSDNATFPDGAVPGAQTCPYLGIPEDPQTCVSYPSHWNLCHRARPAALVKLSYQRDVCLGGAHVHCPVFQREEIKPLPLELRER